MAMNKSFPWKLTVDILSRLGVDDLLRYRAVCKPWRSLIDGPDFVKLHLSRSPQSLIFGGRKDLFLADPRALTDTPRLLSNPLDTGTRINVVGSCNGLVVIVNPDTTFAAIWNPSTRKHVPVPRQKYPPLPNGAVIDYGISGFGYDSVSDDYKLLGLIDFRNSFVDPVFHLVEVYSLRALAWKKVNNFPPELCYAAASTGILVRNALHWYVMRLSDRSGALLAFDMATEDTRELPLPDHPDLRRFDGYIMNMAELGGRVCMAALGELSPSNRTERVDMWVMQEYGVKESWTMLFSVGPSSPTDRFASAVPLMYLEKSEGENGGGGGDRILMNWSCDTFAAYDLKKKSVEQMKVPGIQRIFGSLLHVTSLVAVGGDGSESASKEAGDSRKEGGEKPKPKPKPDANKKRVKDGFLSIGFRLVL